MLFFFSGANANGSLSEFLPATLTDVSLLLVGLS